MPKKRDTRRDAGAAKPKQLRKRLRKAEDQLEDARTKRDRAQARVDALSIIADEIRAQLAEVEKAEAERKAEKADKAKSAPKATPKDDAAASAETDASPGQKAPAAKRPTPRKPAAKTPAAKAKTAAARKAAVPRTAAAASASDTARKKPGTARPAAQ